MRCVACILCFINFNDHKCHFYIWLWSPSPFHWKDPMLLSELDSSFLPTNLNKDKGWPRVSLDFKLLICRVRSYISWSWVKMSLSVRMCFTFYLYLCLFLKHLEHWCHYVWHCVNTISHRINWNLLSYETKNPLSHAPWMVRRKCQFIGRMQHSKAESAYKNFNSTYLEKIQVQKNFMV
jgi:hypothetical protein